MKPTTLRFFVIIFITFLVGYYFGINKVSFSWKYYKPALSVVNKEAPVPVQHIDFSLFWTVWQKLENSYFDKKALDPQKLVNGAISGMVQSLGDPYTVFLPAKQNSEFKQGLSGQFEGIGAKLDLKDNQIIVQASLDGSPAQKAGVRAGDAIIKVDNESTAGWSLNQAVEKIRGPKGSTVVITLFRKEEKKEFDVSIIRNTIVIESVSGWVKNTKDVKNVKLSKTTDASVLYLKLSQFGDNTNKEWIQIIKNLLPQIQKEKYFKGAILDLRNNPGGYLSDATFIASEFIRSGTVVTQEKGNLEKTVFSVSRSGQLLRQPLVILINKGSASASEIVAIALRDHNRAKIIGETSFGKGTIQQAEDLGGGAGIHITIAKWLSPKGEWLNGKGIKPDIEVGIDSKDENHDAQLEKAVEELLK